MQGGWPPGGGGYGSGAGGYGPPAGAPYSSQSPYGPPAPGFTPQYGTYEFNPYENSILTRTGSRAKLWGTISTVVGVLQIFGSCGMVSTPLLAAYLPAGIVAIVVGLTFIGAGSSLKAVVTTQGNDLMHLMQAMHKMSTAFIIQIVCVVIGFALAVIGIVLAMFVFAVRAASG